MPNQQPSISSVTGRKFVCSAAATLMFIVDENERFLMLSRPKHPGQWEVVCGAIDAAETILDCVLRETREELGEQVQVRPLGVLHAYTFRFDDNVQYMLGVAYLLAYEGGDMIPGHEMAGSEVHWFRIDEVESGKFDVIVPQQHWMFRRALELYCLWKDRLPVELQPVFGETT